MTFGSHRSLRQNSYLSLLSLGITGFSSNTKAFCFGAAGEIRTLGTLLAYTRFPVVLVMTASILLRIGALDSKNDYTKNHSKVKHKFEKCAIF